MEQNSCIKITPRSFSYYGDKLNWSIGEFNDHGDEIIRGRIQIRKRMFQDAVAFLKALKNRVRETEAAAREIREMYTTNCHMKIKNSREHCITYILSSYVYI